MLNVWVIISVNKIILFFRSPFHSTFVHTNQRRRFVLTSAHCGYRGYNIDFTHNNKLSCTTKKQNLVGGAQRATQ